MKSSYLGLILAGMVFLGGCALPQSPESRAREAQERRDADKRNKAFTNALPPVPNAEQPLRY